MAAKRVVVTRPEHQAAEMADALHRSGLVPLEIPVIEIEEVDGLHQRLIAAVANGVDWMVFTSVNTVTRVAALVSQPAGVKVAAIGPGTAEALSSAGWQVELVPEEFVAESLVAAFPAGSGRVVIPRAERARDVLPNGLAEKGWQVELVVAYRTVDATASLGDRKQLASADAIAFTASSTVEAFVRSYGIAALPPLVACIGPVTADTARQFGMNVDVQAERHTIEGLVEAIATAL